MGNYRNKNTMYCTNIIINNFSKDARLPVQLQRAMAKEAEAARDARAKVLTDFHLLYCFPNNIYLHF